MGFLYGQMNHPRSNMTPCSRWQEGSMEHDKRKYIMYRPVSAREAQWKKEGKKYALLRIVHDGLQTFRWFYHEQQHFVVPQASRGLPILGGFNYHLSGFHHPYQHQVDLMVTKLDFYNHYCQSSTINEYHQENQHFMHHIM